jgi:hypothetical protein
MADPPNATHHHRALLAMKEASPTRLAMALVALADEVTLDIHVNRGLARFVVDEALSHASGTSEERLVKATLVWTERAGATWQRCLDESEKCAVVALSALVTAVAAARARPGAHVGAAHEAIGRVIQLLQRRAEPRKEVARVLAQVIEALSGEG